METSHFTAPADSQDLWTLYDAPHFEAVTNALVFVAFMRSASTESVACHSMFGTIALRAHGPDGGKVTFYAVRSHLDPSELDQLMRACEEARAAGKFHQNGERLQESV